MVLGPAGHIGATLNGTAAVVYPLYVAPVGGTAWMVRERME